jgi:hypothetical protein
MARDSLRLTLLSPLPEYLDEKEEALPLAPRPESLDGQTLGLLPNWRPSAVNILEEVGELLGHRYRLRGLTREQPSSEVPSRTGGLIDALIDRLDDLASRVDVVITATGD